MTTQLMEELERTISLLEAQIPANPNSTKSRELAQRLAKSLARYFRRLEDAFPYSQVERLYNKYVKEALGTETRGILDPMLGAFDKTLKCDIMGSNSRSCGNCVEIGNPIAHEGNFPRIIPNIPKIIA